MYVAIDRDLPRNGKNERDQRLGRFGVGGRWSSRGIEEGSKYSTHFAFHISLTLLANASG